MDAKKKGPAPVPAGDGAGRKSVTDRRDTTGNGGRQALFSRKEAAQYLGLAMQTLASWASPGRKKPKATKGPAFVKLGRAVRYRQSDRYLAENTATPGA